MSVFKPDWPTPKNIQSLCTTRDLGCSHEPWDQFNLATHVGDELNHVLKNREQLVVQGHLPADPEWLNQTHSTLAVQLEQTRVRDADASITQKNKQVSVVLTADCLPLLLCDQHGREVAAIHAGWKGLLDGIIIKTIQAMQSKPNDLMVWLGPAISQQHFEIGASLRQQFCDTYDHVEQYFKSHHHKYMADLYGLARSQLHQLGVDRIYGGDFCSYAEQDKFYSYRRDGRTGRMASLIWINNP